MTMENQFIFGEIFQSWFNIKGWNKVYPTY